jgi:hypothetical protein
MGSQVKLIIDRDLGHVLGISSEDNPSATKPLTLEQIVGAAGLLVRDSDDGKLLLPREELELVDLPPYRNAPLEMLLEQPRSSIFTKDPAPPPNGTPTAQRRDAVAIQNTSLSLAKLTTREAIINLTTQGALGSKVRGKAYAQARNNEGEHQILSVRDVDVAVSLKQAFVPIGSRTSQVYDVLVLLEGFPALLIEGQTPSRPA